MTTEALTFSRHKRLIQDTVSVTSASNLQKKTVYGIAVFLCIFAIVRASTSLGGKSSGNIHTGYTEIICPDTRVFPSAQFFGPSIARPGKFGCLTPDQSRQPAPSYANGKVTASWYGQTSQQADDQQTEVRHEQKHPGP
jgi:hypothetical protein